MPKENELPFLNTLSIIKQHRSEFITLSIAFYVVFTLCMVVTAIIIERKSAMALLHNMFVLIKQNRGTVIVFSIAISEVFALGVIFVAFVLGWKAR